MMIRFLFTLMLSVLSFSFAEEAGKEIRVYLQTESSLEPLYLGDLQSQASEFDEAYLAQLKQVLLFDLGYNGSTKVIAPSEQKENILKQQNVGSAFNPNMWKSLGVAYVVKGVASGKSLTLSCLASQTGAIKGFAEVPLTGNLSIDRKQIHKLADSIHKALFNEEGVASTQILYAAKQRPILGRLKGNKWVSEIWMCDWDGANARPITHEGSYCVTPVMIPANPKFPNDKFLYVSYKEGQPKIFIASTKEGVGKRLIDLRGHQVLPAISLQRDKIAFISDAGGRTDLFLQEFSPETGSVGRLVQLFSYPRSTQASPTFSPDGSKVCFVSDKDGAPRIYVISASFTGKRPTPTLLSKKNPENSAPAWSPDGKKIAYSAKTAGVRQIWIYDFERQEEWQLTDGPGNKENISWAPNSRHIVFNSNDGTSSELFIVNLNQGEVIKISHGSGIKHYPTWGVKG